MIPKKIHYCWFGKAKMPMRERHCITSWKKYLQDYEFILWDEERFNVDSAAFTKEAYKAGKYAFVADYVRVYALCKEGGIYLDTDVEVIKPLDDLLDCSFLTGFETENIIQTGLIGAETTSSVIMQMFDYYRDRHFIINDKMDQTPNSVILAEIIKSLGFELNNQYQCRNGIFLYPAEYFCPINQATWEVRPTRNSYCIHYLSGSWLPVHDRINRRLKTIIGRVFGYGLIEKVRRLVQ